MPSFIWTLRDYRTNVSETDEASEFVANRVPSDFAVGLYIGLPQSWPIAGERGTSPVRFTSHFPEVIRFNHPDV